MKHALVVGGTGMLRETTRWLELQGYHVSVIGRNANRLNQTVQGKQDHFTKISLDYTNSDDLAKELARTIDINGPINLVVAWIHSTAPGALQIIHDVIAPSSPACSLFHVKGSTRSISKEKPFESENMSYHQILLGFVLEGDLSRWLTHDEIVSGVIAAIQTKQNEFVIGTLEPWEKRP